MQCILELQWKKKMLDQASLIFLFTKDKKSSVVAESSINLSAKGQQKRKFKENNTWLARYITCVAAGFAVYRDHRSSRRPGNWSALDQKTWPRAGLYRGTIISNLVEAAHGGSCIYVTKSSMEKRSNKLMG